MEDRILNIDERLKPLVEAIMNHTGGFVIAAVTPEHNKSIDFVAQENSNGQWTILSENDCLKLSVSHVKPKDLYKLFYYIATRKQKEVAS